MRHNALTYARFAHQATPPWRTASRPSPSGAGGHASNVASCLPSCCRTWSTMIIEARVDDEYTARPPDINPVVNAHSGDTPATPTLPPGHLQPIARSGHMTPCHDKHSLFQRSGGQLTCLPADISCKLNYSSGDCRSCRIAPSNRCSPPHPARPCMADNAYEIRPLRCRWDTVRTLSQMR
jgi:hypothetical protein